MEAGKASRSAMGSGLLRAAHVREDRPPWVFEDTLARQLLDMAAYTREEVAGLLAEAGFGGADLFDAGRLRDRYLRGRPDLPLHAATVIAVATV